MNNVKKRMLEYFFKIFMIKSLHTYFFWYTFASSNGKDHIPWQNKTFGEVAEWSIAPVLKTGVLRGTGGSNPSLSAEI